MLGGGATPCPVGIGVIGVSLVFLVRVYICMSAIEDIWAWFLLRGTRYTMI